MNFENLKNDNLSISYSFLIDSKNDSDKSFFNDSLWKIPSIKNDKSGK